MSYFAPDELYGKRIASILQKPMGSYFSGDPFGISPVGMGYLGALGMTTIGATDNFAMANKAAMAAVQSAYASWSSPVASAVAQVSTLQSMVPTLQQLASQGSSTAANTLPGVTSALSSVGPVMDAQNVLANLNSQIQAMDAADKANQLQMGHDWVWLQNTVLPPIKTQIQSYLDAIQALTLSNAVANVQAAVQQAQYEVKSAATRAAQAAAAAIPPPSLPTLPTTTGPGMGPAPPTDYMAQFMAMMKSQMQPQPSPSFQPPIPIPLPMPPMDFGPPPAPSSSSTNIYGGGYGLTQDQVNAMVAMALAQSQGPQAQPLYDVPADSFVTESYTPGQQNAPSTRTEMFGMGASVSDILGQIDAARAKIQTAIASVPALAPLARGATTSTSPPPVSSTGSNLLKYGAIGVAAYVGYRFLKGRSTRRKR